MPKILCVLLTLLLMSSVQGDEGESLLQISAVPDSMDYVVRADFQQLVTSGDNDNASKLMDGIAPLFDEGYSMLYNESERKLFSSIKQIELCKQYYPGTNDLEHPSVAIIGEIDEDFFQSFLKNKSFQEFNTHHEVKIFRTESISDQDGLANLPFICRIDLKYDVSLIIASPNLASIRLMIETVVGKRKSLLDSASNDQNLIQNDKQPWMIVKRRFINAGKELNKFNHMNLFTSPYDEMSSALIKNEKIYEAIFKNLSEIESTILYLTNLESDQQFDFTFNFSNPESASETELAMLEMKSIFSTSFRQFPQNANNPKNLDTIDQLEQTRIRSQENQLQFSRIINSNLISKSIEWIDENRAKGEITSKVNRVKADMRSLSTGIESYKVDNNRAPAATLDPSKAIAARNQTISNTSDSMSYFMSYDSSKRGPMTITTPIAYMSSLPADPFSHDQKQPFAYFTTGRNWILQSPGPDGDHDIMAESLMAIPHENWVSELKLLTYDASNGVISSGDIWRIDY